MYLSSLSSAKGLTRSDITDNKIYSIIKNINRPLSDNRYLVNYFSNLHPFYDFIVESRGDKALEILKNLCFMFMWYSESKDKVIFYHGDKDERCFVLLEGQVNIISPSEEEVQMTEDEYIRYLITLRSYYEIDLLREVIEENGDVFLIEGSFDNWIRRAYQTIQLLKDNKDKEKDNKKKPSRRRSQNMKEPVNTFETKQLKALVLHLEKDIIAVYNQLELDSFNANLNESRNHFISAMDYIDRLKPVHSEASNCIIDKRLFKVKTYFISQTITKGEIFGEVLYNDIHIKANQCTKRTSTAIISQDTKCAYLSKEAFNDLLRLTLEKLKRLRIDFLLNLGIFSKVNRAAFIKSFAICIKKVLIANQTVLYEENDSIGKDRYVYFIQSGQFEANCTKSIQDIDQVLNRQLHEISNEQVAKEYMRRKAFKLAIFGENDIIGLDDFSHGGKYLFTIKCISMKGIVFQMHYEFFQLLMKTDANVKSRTEELQSVKIEIRNRLLKQQKDVRLQSICNRQSRKNKESSPTERNANQITTQSFKYTIKHKLKIDSALREEHSSTSRISLKKKEANAKLLIAGLKLKTLANNKHNKKNLFEKLSYNIGKERNPLDHDDRIQRKLLKQKTQLIEFNVTNCLTTAIFNTHIDKQSTIDNDISFKVSNRQLVTETSEGAISTRCSNLKQKNSVFKREASHINPLAYDDFERKYNTEYYFNVYGDSLRKKEDKYHLRLTDSNSSPISNRNKRDFSQKKHLIFHQTISSNKTSSPPHKLLSSMKRPHRPIQLH